MNKNILCLDLGTRNLGIALILENKNIKTKTFHTKPKENLKITLYKIFTELNRLCKKYNIKIICYEQPVPGKINNSLFILEGFVLLLCHIYNIQEYATTPTKLKKSLTGDYHAKKDIIKKYVLNYFSEQKIKFEDENQTDHEYDALGLFCLYHKENANRFTMPTTF
jgi:Holliday junction resolvasome RuvABC endonuclease subunit